MKIVCSPTDARKDGDVFSLRNGTSLPNGPSIPSSLYFLVNSYRSSKYMSITNSVYYVPIIDLV